MNDQNAYIHQLKQMAQQLVNERDWNQFNCPKNLSCNLSVEANELLEHFTWITTQESLAYAEKHRQKIEDELADVFLTLLLFANSIETDITKAFLHKLENIKQRYPVAEFKGKITTEHKK